MFIYSFFSAVDEVLGALLGSKSKDVNLLTATTGNSYELSSVLSARRDQTSCVAQKIY